MLEFPSILSYQLFENLVPGDSRYILYPVASAFLDVVIATAQARRRVLEKDEIFWRAVRGHKPKRTISSEDGYDIEKDVDLPTRLQTDEADATVRRWKA
ncbi:MAG: hypothetical protein M3Y27_01205 [Acidobacteriota bacterium]|nr:hypothetical protein [Acidobacteriota bacterium]